MPVKAGYTLPSEIKNDTASIKAAQTRLGVKADGVWGPISSAAYNSGSTLSKPTVRQATTPTTPTPKKPTPKSPTPTAAAYNPSLTNVTHKSGYSGLGYTKNGNTYTDYGALVRDDNFYYPTGSKISPNGMYYDNGNGWQYAGYATAFKDGKVLAPVKSSMYGAAPGTEVMRVSKSAATATPATSVTPDATPDTGITTPVVTADDVALELRKREIARQLSEYADWQKTLAGY